MAKQFAGPHRGNGRQEAPKQKPVQRFSAFSGNGYVQVDVWANPRDNNRVSYSVSVQKAFKREGSDQWESNTSFFPNEALILATLLGNAWTWIQQNEASE